MLADKGTAAGRPNPPASCAGRQPARQLQQSERIPARLGNDPIQHALIQPSRQDGLQQRPRITMAQGLDAKLRQTRERVAQLSRREHDAIFSASRRRATNASARADARSSHCASSTTHRSGLLLRSLRQQAEDRQPDEERVRSAVRRSARRRRQVHRAADPAGAP